MEEEVRKELEELKEAIRSVVKKLERLENLLLWQRKVHIPEPPEPRIKPFFVKGHDMPIVVSTIPRDPIRGRFLTLKVLYDKSEPLLVEDVCKKTGRSRSLEASYLNDLARDGLVKKERIQINDRERIRYKITEAGKKVMENLLH